MNTRYFAAGTVAALSLIGMGHAHPVHADAPAVSYLSQYVPYCDNQPNGPGTDGITVMVTSSNSPQQVTYAEGPQERMRTPFHPIKNFLPPPPK